MHKYFSRLKITKTEKIATYSRRNMKIQYLIFVGIVFGSTRSQSVNLQEYISGSNAFTAAVYKEILKERDVQENFLMSPFSVETIMALTLSGAKEDTADEIRSALKLPQDQEKIYATFKELLPEIQSDEEYFLNTANKIYAKTNFTLNEDFKKIASEVFDSSVEAIDFGQTEHAAQVMNQWVSEQTEEKIKDLISPAKLSEITRMILINALYFKGNWTKPFESGVEKPFYKSSKSDDEIKALTMCKTDFFSYAENPELNAKFLELDFSAPNVSMVIVLPNDKDGLTALENQIEKVFAEQKLTENVVEVALPKFKFDSKVIFNEILQNLGVKKAFSEAADLSGIAGAKGELFISDVIQKTFMDVNEEGVEAASATFVGIVLRDSIDTSNRKFFIADHPFLFYIKIKGVVVFAGKIVDPKY